MTTIYLDDSRVIRWNFLIHVSILFFYHILYRALCQIFFTICNGFYHIQPTGYNKYVPLIKKKKINLSKSTILAVNITINFQNMCKSFFLKILKRDNTTVFPIFDLTNSRRIVGNILENENKGIPVRLFVKP